MDSHALKFYTPYADHPTNRHFHEVIPLHEKPHLEWKTITKQVPTLNKGWFELAHLSTQDRIEFTQDYWLSRLPFHCGLLSALHNFFSSLDDIGIFAIQPKFEDPFDIHFVYSIREDGGFFYGRPPASEEYILTLQKEFSTFILPPDYLAFLQIHNGFTKATDSGIHRAEQMRQEYEQFQEFVRQVETVITTGGDPVDATTLIPFYQSFNRPFYQCFLGDWYPDQEMGNVYFSGITHTVSDFYSTSAASEKLAFPSFLDWLIFYLEKID